MKPLMRKSSNLTKSRHRHPNVLPLHCRGENSSGSIKWQVRIELPDERKVEELLTEGDEGNDPTGLKVLQNRDALLPIITLVEDHR